jgi:hypothetical protein
MLTPLKFDPGFLIGALRERGVSVWYDRDRDKLCVWPSLVSEAEVSDLRAHKDEIIMWLQRYLAERLPDEATSQRWQSEARAGRNRSIKP